MKLEKRIFTEKQWELMLFLRSRGKTWIAIGQHVKIQAHRRTVRKAFFERGVNITEIKCSKPKCSRRVPWSIEQSSKIRFCDICIRSRRLRQQRVINARKRAKAAIQGRCRNHWRRKSVRGSKMCLECLTSQRQNTFRRRTRTRMQKCSWCLGSCPGPHNARSCPNRLTGWSRAMSGTRYVKGKKRTSHRIKAMAEIEL